MPAGLYKLLTHTLLPLQHMKTVLITGATSGIGLALAKQLDPHYRLVLTGRRQERLDELQKMLGTSCYTLCFDVRDAAAVKAAFDSLPSDFATIDILINNAGNAHGLETIDQAHVEDWDAMMDINVKGLLYVSKAVIPGMVQRQQGHIINVSSIAGRSAYPAGAVYCASKAAVDKITEGMRIDLNPYNIKVGQIAPGLVETEFSLVRFKGDEARAAAVYAGLQPLTALNVAETIRYMIEAPAHVNLADVLLLPTAQASATVVKREAK